MCSGYDDLLPQCLGGVDVNSATQGGDTPLHWAVSERNLAVVRLLLDHNANVMAVNQRGDTPASLSRAVGGDMDRLLADRAEEQQKRQQQQQQQHSEANVPMSTFAVSSASADSGAAGVPKKKMTIKLKPKK